MRRDWNRNRLREKTLISIAADWHARLDAGKNALREDVILKSGHFNGLQTGGPDLPSILFLDPDATRRKAFRSCAGGNFRLTTPSSAAAAVRALQSDPGFAAAIVSEDLGAPAISLLAKIREDSPASARWMLLTESDPKFVSAAINEGGVQHCFRHPWDELELIEQLQDAARRQQDRLAAQYVLQERLLAIEKAIGDERTLVLGVLASGLAHHIRNALVSVRTFIELAPSKSREQGSKPGAGCSFWTDFHDKVQKEVSSITAMLSNLTVASELSLRPFRDRIQLGPALDRVLNSLEPLRADRQIQIVNNIPSDLPLLTVNVWNFVRLLELLITDELTTLPARSEIRLGASVIRSGANPPELEFIVEDNGPRLTPDQIESAFHPFFLRHDDPGAHGVNLIVCYFLAHHHGGRLTVANRRRAKGVCFSLRMPLKPEPRSPRPRLTEALARLCADPALWKRIVGGP